MALIIDTYNVLQVEGVLPAHLAAPDTWNLIDLIAESRYRRQQTCLVCDGSPHREAPDGHFGLLHLIYAGPGSSADALIEAMIGQSSNPRHLTLVTLDRALATSAERSKCRIVRSDRFLAELAHDHNRATARRRREPARAPSVPLPPGEVDQWVRLFGLDRANLSPRGREVSDSGPGSPDPLSEAQGIDMDDLLRENGS